MVGSTTELAREVHKRAALNSLTVDCAGDGVFNASLAIVAEAPGDRECVLKQNLCGGSGKLLWDTVRDKGITRRNAYVTNIVKRKLVQTESGTKIAISKGEIDHWTNLLLWELSQLPNLRHILILGNMPLKGLLGVDGITNWRGSVMPVTKLSTRHVTALCALNPAHVLRQPKLEIIFKFDMDKLERMLKGEIKEYIITPVINPPYREAMSYIKQLCADDRPISLDIETLSNETACVGLTNNAHTGMCINWRTSDGHQYQPHEESELRLALHSLLTIPGKQFVAQNGAFDASWLWYKDRVGPMHVWFDTMLAHHTLYPSLPHDLGFLTTQYTDHPYYKDECKEWKNLGEIDRFWEYNIKDCCITLACMLRLREELREQKLDKFFYSHVMRLQPHLVKMTVLGMKSDVTLKTDITTALTETVAQKEQAFYDAVHASTGDEEYYPSPRSPLQLRELFFKRLRLVGRGPSVDAENRQRMLDNVHTSPTACAVLLALENYTKDNKFLSTYAEMAVDEDDRVRCMWKQHGVVQAPGRLSSSATLWGCGMNMQNQPQRAYPMYIADPGYEFSYFDMSQIEARIVAYLANIKQWKVDFERARLEHNFDAHRALASVMFNVPYDDVPTKDRTPDDKLTIRYIAKRCRHGLNYRMGPNRLAQVTGLSLLEATRNYRLYHKINPEIEAWWDATIQEVKTHRELWTPLGRRWILLERLTEEALESVIAFRPQSTCGDKVASVIYKCQDDPCWPVDARVMLNIHDALIVMNRPKDGPLVRSIMREYAEEPIVINGETLIIPAEFGVSQPDERGVHRWSTIKKIK